MKDIRQIIDNCKKIGMLEVDGKMATLREPTENFWQEWERDSEYIISLGYYICKIIHRSMWIIVDTVTIPDLQSYHSVQPFLSKKYEEKIIANQIYPITMADFLIRSVNKKCAYEKHELININAVVPVRIKGLLIREHKIEAAYCPSCNKYFLSRIQYDAIMKMGIPCCNVIEDEKLLTSGEFNYKGLNDESILIHYGYNVNSVDDLSASERREALIFIIENRIRTTEQVINILYWFINNHGRQNKNMKDAIRKWEEDIEFMRGYRIDSHKEVRVRSIYVTNYYKH